MDKHMHNPEASTTMPKEDAFQKFALKLYQCKDGSMVKDPRDCRGTINDTSKFLPNLELG